MVRRSSDWRGRLTLLIALALGALQPGCSRVREADSGHRKTDKGHRSAQIERYTGMCDASGAVAVGTDRFIVACDEDSVLRLYRRNQPGPPTQAFDLSSFLRLTGKHPETDLEAATRLGDRVYWLGSHGRNRDGKARANRRRFFATSVTIAMDGQVRVTPIGQPYTHLLDDLRAAPQLARFHLSRAAKKAPKDKGALNIEGLCGTPDGHLLLGFRNPIPHGRALLVPLLNPVAVIDGRQRAQLGEPILLDLGGLGVRDLAYAQGRFLIVAGPFNGHGHFHLYLWDGRNAPVEVKHVSFGDLHPEAAIRYPDTQWRRVQLLSDDGARTIDGCECKKLPDPSQRFFRSVWVDLP